ncbi:MAG: hypothetical protein JWM86_285 [Thermoleophilia bacterium]|nr:hypothetical protein [Thermoleophilia bacterium]
MTSRPADSEQIPFEPSTDPDQPQLAGMALRNGVMALGPTSWAVAIRGADGEITTTARPRPRGGEGISTRVPLLRGPVRLANMMRVLPQIRRSVPGARLALESPGLIAATVASSIAAARLRRGIASPMLGELVGSASSLALTMASMRSGDVARYHGAEHKAVAGYEQGIAAADASRVHPRCGTQLAIPLLVFSSLATQAALAVAPRNPKTARAVGQVIGVAVATEFFRAASRGKGTALGRAAARAGEAIQLHATTAEPTREQLDVAEAAVEAVLAAERSRA